MNDPTARCKRQANTLAERAVMWDRVADQMMDRMTDDDDGEEDMGFLIVAFVDRLVARAQAAEAEAERLRQENDTLRRPITQYTEEGDFTPGWVPVDAGRLAELESAETELNAMQRKED